MNRRSGWLALLAGIMLISGCGGDANRESGLRLVHAAPDAPPINLLVNDVPVRSGIDYRQGTRLLLLRRGSYTFDIDGIGPAGALKLLDAPLNRALTGDTNYTLVLVGSIADGTLEVVELTDTRGAAPAGATELRVLHAAEGLGGVDIYLTEPDAELASSTPVAMLAGYLDDSGALDIAAGTRQLRVTAASDPGNVLFDAGNINLAANARLFIAAVANTTPGGSPLVLVVNTGTSQGELLDRNTPGLVRSVHLSPDTGPLDVEARAGLDETAPVTALATGLTYPESSGYRPLSAGQYQLRVIDPAQDPEDESAGPLLSFIQGVQPGQSYSLFITGPGEQPLQRVLLDRRRPVATEARLRILHASPEAGAVDIYVKRPSQPLADAVLIFRNVGLRVETGQRLLPPDDYLVVVTPPGDATERTLELLLELAGGDVNTLVLRDAPGGGEPLGLMLLEDRADL